MEQVVLRAVRVAESEESCQWVTFKRGLPLQLLERTPDRLEVIRRPRGDSVRPTRDPQRNTLKTSGAVITPSLNPHHNGRTPGAIDVPVGRRLNQGHRFPHGHGQAQAAHIGDRVAHPVRGVGERGPGV